jgi:hypothetical protein
MNNSEIPTGIPLGIIPYHSQTTSLSPVMGIPIDLLEDKKNYFFDLCQLYEINQKTIDKMYLLNECDIVIIADDSGSMRQRTFGNKTRWEQLKKTISICAEVISCIGSSALDLCFVNRHDEYYDNIQSSQDIEQIFHNREPCGLTPLIFTLNQILRRKKNSKKLLILIATDGEPTDFDTPGVKTSYKSISEFKKVLMEKSDNVYVNILACTDDKESMKYLDRWDNEIKNLDVIESYLTERNQILSKGKIENFSFGEYVIKALIGSLDENTDKLDELSNEYSGNFSQQASRDFKTVNSTKCDCCVVS